MKHNQINKFFPISSQTSVNDKKILLKIRNLIKKNESKKYCYLEIGSFLGGSLTPFLMDKKCQLVVSIDKRNQNLEDERSEKWSYENFSERQMIKKLKDNNLNISKIKTFDGDIGDFKTNKKFDLVFIDGIHTDKNTFSDFLYSFEKVKKNSIILFHDSSVIFKSISLIEIFLIKNKYNFKLAKFKGSEITGIFFGNYSKLNLSKSVSSIEKFEKFYLYSSENLLLQQINNRIKIKFKLSRFLKKKFPYKLSLKNKEKKRSLDFHK